MCTTKVLYIVNRNPSLWSIGFLSQYNLGIAKVDLGPYTFDQSLSSEISKVKNNHI